MAKVQASKQDIRSVGNAGAEDGTLLLTVPEAARRLRLGLTTTKALIYSGRLPSVRIGRSVRVPLADLKRWVEEQAQIAA